MGLPVFLLSMVLCVGSPPLNTSGLVLHLETDANLATSGTNVTSWGDQSGNGNNLNASGNPTIVNGALNGLPAIHFDGINDKLERGSFTALPTGSSDRTVFVLARYNDVGPGGFSYGHITCNTVFGLIVRPPAGDLLLTGYCNSADQSTAEPGTGTGWLIHSVILESNIARQFRDGRQIDSGAHTYVTGNSRIVLGAEVDSNPFLDMDAAAVLIYNTALSDTAHADVVEYLREKYLGDLAPVALDDYARMNRTSTTTIDVVANDTPSDEIDPTTVAIDTPPANGVVSVDAVTGEITYTHWAIDMKPDSFTYTIDNMLGQTSAPATVNIGIDDPGCPLITTDLAMHLDAGIGVRLLSGSVRSWTDLSPFGNHMEADGGLTLTTAALNGHDVVSFDGVDDMLERISGLEGFRFGANDRSMFVVVNYQGFGTGGVSYGATTCNGTFGLVTQVNGNLMLMGWCGVHDFPTTTPGTGAGWLVHSAVTEGGWFQHSVDGLQIDNQFHPYATQTDRMVVAAEISGSPHVQMQVAEILVYREALSIADRAQVVDHLRAKYFDEFCTVPCLPPQLTLEPVPDTTCTGDSFSVDVVATGTMPLFYQWRRNGMDIAGANSATYTVASASVSDAGTYDVVVTNACGSATSMTAEVTINTPIALQTNPQSLLGCEGGSATFTVSATGTAPTYQWRKNGTPISGATASSLSLTNLMSADAGDYDVVVTGTCSSSISSSANLIVNPPAVITEQPVPQVGCLGGSVTMTVTATGTGLSYQWRKNGATLVGATANILTLANLTLADADAYDVQITGDCNVLTSSIATVLVNEPAAVQVQPTGATLCPGEAHNFTVTPAGSPPFTYEWRRNGTTIPGATGLSLTISSATEGDDGSYDVVVGNSCGSVTSASAVLDVLDPPAFTSVPGTTFVCLGTSAMLSVTTTGPPPLTYEWLKDGVPISGATTDTLTLSPVDALDSGSYTVEVTSVCTTTSSAPFDVIVDSLPQIVTAPTALTVCEGFLGELTVVASSASPLTYQWRKNGLNVVGATSDTLTFGAAMLSDSGTFDVVITNDCNFVTTAPVQLSVTDASICDCNGNGVLDPEDVLMGTSPDCNMNGIPDECDISSGSSLDVDQNGIPDDCGFFDRGDCNTDASFNIADVVYLLGFSFPGMSGPNPLSCEDACDCNDDGALNIADAVCFLGFLFGNPPITPAPPFGSCGLDVDDSDPLDCDDFPCP